MPSNKMFRCLNPKCQPKEMGRFQSLHLRPKCPQCGLDSKDPKFGHLVQRLVIVHFDPPTEFHGHGQNHRACEPGAMIQAGEGNGTIPRPWDAGTGDPNAVTCDACKKTAAYRAAWEAENDDVLPSAEGDDDELRITPAIAGSFDRIQRITTPVLKK